MKIEFTTIESLTEWLQGRESKYEIYIAKNEGNVVAMPTVSTRPIKVGVAPYKENINKVIEDIKRKIPNIEGRIFIVDTVDYNIAER
ncbi:MAG: hypothetical protein PHP08_00045 [Candidatus Dojkabacteria bacterium]|nr:hypothetical protein [Candidatus Dojkabacteria bacterium]